MLILMTSRNCESISTVFMKYGAKWKTLASSRGKMDLLSIRRIQIFSIKKSLSLSITLERYSLLMNFIIIAESS